MKKMIKRLIIELVVAALILNSLVIYAQFAAEEMLIADVPLQTVSLLQTPSSLNAAILPENNLCKEQGKVMIGFFNGVLNSKSQAEDGKKALKKIYGNKTIKGEPITYDLFYNYSNNIDDFIEVFQQIYLEEQKADKTKGSKKSQNITNSR